MIYPNPKYELITIKEALKDCEALTCSGDCPANNKKLLCTLRINEWERIFKTIGTRLTYSGIHPNGNRYFSIEELKRGQSFYDSFEMLGSITNLQKQIGNSVPPLLMYAIAKHINNNILTKGT